jgi:hypothetical protein
MHTIDIALREDIYQTYHPFILSTLQRKAVLGSTSITLDGARAAFIFDQYSAKGRKVLDIGANQGYMSIEAALRGARQIDAFESNAVDSHFLSQAASALFPLRCLSVHGQNYRFDLPPALPWDCVLCLNVLHHVGRYFDQHVETLADAKANMAQHLQSLLSGGAQVWLQLGFNWQGDVRLPLFAHGTKREMTNYVAELAGPKARIATIGIYNPNSQTYEAVAADNTEHALWQRMEGIGEFANRPLYLIESVV